MGDKSMSEQTWELLQAARRLAATIVNSSPEALQQVREVLAESTKEIIRRLAV